MIALLDVVLFAFLVVVAIGIIRQRNLFAAVMLLGIFSLLSALLFTVMDAVDVAFTEAAVGAGVSTVLLLGTLALTGRREAVGRTRPRLTALVVVLLTGYALVYGTLDMPRYGDPEAPVHTSPVAKHYIEKQPEEIGVPNIVTAVLASYRGHDTFGETTVVFTAVVGVLLLLGGTRRPRRVPPPGPPGDRTLGLTDPERRRLLDKADADTEEGGDAEAGDAA